MIKPITRPTIAERRAAVQAALRESPHWSDRRLAAALGVTRDMVFTERCRLEQAGKIIGMLRVQGKDGKDYPACKVDQRKPRTRSFAEVTEMIWWVARDLSLEKYRSASLADLNRFHVALKMIREVAG